MIKHFVFFNDSLLTRNIVFENYFIDISDNFYHWSLGELYLLIRQDCNRHSTCVFNLSCRKNNSFTDSRAVKHLRFHKWLNDNWHEINIFGIIYMCSANISFVIGVSHYRQKHGSPPFFIADSTQGNESNLN